MTTATKAALSLAAAASMVAASAAPINGIITFGGLAILDNANSALATQATIASPNVLSSSGAFSGVASGTAASFTSPLVVGVNPGQIWSVGGFTFTASGPLLGGGGQANTFALGVLGTVDDGPGGGDPTPALFAFTTTPTIGGLGAFASITASKGDAVPDSGTTCMLLGAGLVALGARKRLMS